MDIRAKINRLVNGGWNYPSRSECLVCETDRINSLQEQIQEISFKYNALKEEHTTLSVMYSELKANPTLELDKIRDAYIELECSYEKTKRIVDDEYNGAYHRGFNDGIVCAYEELGWETIVEGGAGQEDEEIDLDDLEFEDNLANIFGDPMKELDELCESLHR